MRHLPRQVLWLIGTVLAAGISHAGAAEPAADQAPARAPAAVAPAVDADVPPFHRSYVPAAQLKRGNWTRGYLPIDAEEFRRLVETVHAGAIGAPGAGAATIEQSEYTGQLVGDDLLVGKAVLQLARGADGGGMLIFDPCSLALGKAEWKDQDAKPATVGTGPDGRLRVLVEGSTLELGWSLRAKATASGGVGFQVNVPACPITRITLDVPTGLELLADSGIATKSGTVEASGRARWKIELGGHNRVTLRAAAEGAARERRPLTLLRQSLTYDLSSRGVNVAAQLKLDVHGDPLQRIALELDPGLRLVAARYGELQIPLAVTEHSETGQSRVVLQLPEPIAGTGRVLQLAAIAPLVVDARWSLPGIRLENMAWQEGTVTLLIPGDLVLEQLTTNGCRQSRMAALPAPASGESIEIQCFRPDAAVDVLLAEPRDQLRIDSGTLVEVGMNEVTSQQAVELSAARGEHGTIRLDVHSPWNIDAVEGAAANQPLDWEMEERGSGGGRLKIRLHEAVAPDRAVRLIVRGHRALPPAPSFEARQLLMLDLDERSGGERLLSVRGVEGMELRWAGAVDLRRLDPLKLTPEQSRRFPQSPTGVLFTADAALAQSTVGLDRRKASYEAEIRIDAVVQAGVLTETYTIQCVPETSRVDRLLVRFSQVRDAPLEWNSAGANSGQFSARRITAAEQAQVGLPEGGEAWELNLHLARPGAFEVRAVRSADLKGVTPVSLASVAQATVQHGSLTIRALGDAGLTIKNRRLTSIPPELLEADRYQTSRATYHYQPGRDDLGGEPAVSVAPAGHQQATSGAWAWSSRLDSRYPTAGTAVHWATFHLQTAGQQQVHVTLPTGAHLQAAWIDQDRLPLALTAGDDPVLTVNLPAGRAFATLSLYYSTPGGLPTLVTSAEAALAELDVPVMARQWTVWLPPGFDVVESPGQFPIDSMPPMALSERLFSALGRHASAKTFNPLAAAAWEQLVAGPAAARAAAENGRQFAATLGALVSEYLAGEAESELTWGQLLALAAENESQSGRTVVVDAESLAWLRLEPRTRVGFQPGESALERGLALLEQAHLAVLAGPSVIGVTSVSTAAAEARQLALCEHNVVFTVEPGSLAADLGRAAQVNRASNYQLVAVWRATSAGGLPPWTPAEPATIDTRDAAEWRTYTMHLSDDDVPKIRIVHAAAMRALAWPLFLAVMALGIWYRARRPSILLAVAALAGASSLLAPAAYAPLASAVFLGAIVCLAVRMTRIPQRPVPAAHTRSASSRATRSFAHQTAIVLSVAAILSFGAVLLASQPQPAPAPTSPATVQQTNPPAASDAARGQTDATPDGSPAATAVPRQSIYRVFVPVDDEKTEQGDEARKYYVPEGLYNQLVRRAAAASGKRKDWLLTRATYRGSLARDPVTKQLRLAQLKVSFDLDVLQSSADVQLPFPREGTADPVIAARVDGRTIPVTWNATRDALKIGTLLGERYRIELELQAPLQTYGTSAGFDLTVPALADAQLELSVPPDAPTIEVPSARGEIHVQKEQGTLQAQLGACDRISVRWPAGIGMETSAANVEVEELIWVKVRPGTTVFDARFTYRVLEGSTRQIRLLVDPRLRLLPLRSTEAGSPVAAVHAIAGDPQRIDLELARPVSDQVVIDLSFLLTGTSGVGNLQFPRLESSAVRAARRWLAVSVDPALESKEYPGEDSRPIAIADFMAAWGAAESRPQAAYRIPRGEAMWVLSTQPSEPHTTVEQSLTVSLGSGSTLVEYDAALAIDDGYRFQLGIDGPRDLTIEQVSVIEDDVQRIARWSIDDAGRITVFLTGPITGRQHLTLRGRVASSSSGVTTVPRFEFADADVERTRWVVYRQSALLAEVKPGPGVTEFEPEDREPRDEFGILVGAYETDDPQAGLAVKVSPNVPRATAVTLTTLDRDGDRWMAETLCRVTVAEGTVDVLAFEIPPQWVEPYRVEPAARTKVVPVPGEPRLQLIVYPAEPITAEYELKIRGRVALSTGDRLRVPDIVPQRMQHVDRFVMLPQRLDLQQISWETVGLGRATLPAQFATKQHDASSAAVYRVEGEHFQAALKGVERTTITGRVKLADIQVAWQPDDYCQGVASFDLEPAGASNCVLELPAGYRLLHATVENLPAQLVELSANRWRLSLGPPELPQRLVVVYTARLPGSDDRKRFEAPRLLDLRIDETLWTIYSPRDRLVTTVDEKSISPVAASQQELCRLRSIAALAQLPAEILGEHLPAEIARWYRPWRSRYATSRAVLAGDLTVAEQDGLQSAEAIEAKQLDAKIDAVDTRLGSPAPRVPAAVQSRRPESLILASRTALLPTRYLSPHNAREIELRFPSDGRAGWTGRILLSLVLVALAVATILLLGGRELRKFSPGFVMIAAGITWWLFLAPSIAGLVAVAIGIWAALRGRTRLGHRSTVNYASSR